MSGIAIVAVVASIAVVGTVIAVVAVGAVKAVVVVVAGTAVVASFLPLLMLQPLSFIGCCCFQCYCRKIFCIKRSINDIFVL